MTSTTGQQLPDLRDLTTADVRRLVIDHHDGRRLRAVTEDVRAWATAGGLQVGDNGRGPISRDVWTAYAVHLGLGRLTRPPGRGPAPAEVPGGAVPSRCLCSHLRIDHPGGHACKGSCGCQRFRRG